MTAAEVAAIAAAVGFLGIAGFQLALALGAPLGHAAWGGQHQDLPRGLRIASALAVVFWLGAGLVVLARAGVGSFSISTSIARWGAWILVGVLSLGALMNFASRSKWERYLWGPLALILAALCFVVAAG